jgi:hypothetical protein
MRTFSWISAAVCFLIAVPHAQEAGRTTPPPPEPAHDTMSLIGCLAAGSDESTFKLTNAIPNAQASAAQPQPVGTAGARAQYDLRAEKNLATSGIAPVELKRFVGRQVEIAVRSSEEPATSAPPAAASGAKADPDPGKPMEKQIRPLTVTAVKQVRATCL